jgi:hypothetical protein
LQAAAVDSDIATRTREQTARPIRSSESTSESTTGALIRVGLRGCAPRGPAGAQSRRPARRAPFCEPLLALNAARGWACESRELKILRRAKDKRVIKEDR